VLIALLAAVVILAWREPLAQIAVIVAGGVAGLVLPAREVVASAPVEAVGRRHRMFAVAALVAFALLLILLPLLAAGTNNRAVDIAEAAYRSGALVFGGGHVVLPLLDEAVVTPGWIAADTFIAGYGLAQALPGPLFSFAAFLGTAMDYGPGGAAGGALMLVMIYLPSVLLVLGTMPFWEQLRHARLVRRVLSGVNAAVVGLLLAALYDPVLKTSIKEPTDWLLAFAALWALMYLRVPPWAVVAAGAGVGAALAAF
jgi:chromate transporter